MPLRSRFNFNRQKKETPKYLLSLEFLVGAAGFELATPCTPCKCATRLRYAPTQSAHSIVHTLFFQEFTLNCCTLFVPENLDAQGLEILDLRIEVFGDK